MSINDYWTAKTEATEAGGEVTDPNAGTPAETVLPEEPEVEESEPEEPEEKPDPNEGLPAETVPEGAVPLGTPDLVPEGDDPNEGLPAETVDPEAEEEEPEEDPDLEGNEPDGEEDTYEADKAAATAEVPTTASTKAQIREYLIYEHGIDPDDLQDQTKAELLELVSDLAE